MMYTCGKNLFGKAVFYFDAVELFQHRLCAKPEEHERCHCANEINRNAGEVIAQDDLPVDCMRPHERGRGVHNAAVDDGRRDHAEDAEANPRTSSVRKSEACGCSVG